jgi:hypothetical protein
LDEQILQNSHPKPSFTDYTLDDANLKTRCPLGNGRQATHPQAGTVGLAGSFADGPSNKLLSEPESEFIILKQWIS